MRSDLYKNVSKNNIMTYSYMKDYVEKVGPLDDGEKVKVMVAPPRRKRVPDFLKSVLRQK